MTKFFASILALAAMSVLSGPASAAVILADDFDDDSGALTGETATTGQIWALSSFLGNPTSLNVDTIYGTGGTNGAGATGAVGNDLDGNAIALGTTLSTGTFRLEMDMVTGQNTSFSYTQFWLSGGGGNASIGWGQGAAAASPYITFEGLSAGDTLHDVNFGNGVLHVTLDMDLDAKTIEYSWYNVADPGNPLSSGSVNLAYAGAFAPSELNLGIGTQTGGIRGMDNIVLQSPVPEPASILLLAIGIAVVGLGRKTICSGK